MTQATIPTTQANNVLSVSGLNKSVRLLLESGIGQVWVEGEISNMARPGSGHLYFSLKDSEAQVKCAMFKNAIKGDPLRWQNGVQVLAHARVSLYEPRGDYQIIVTSLEEAGLGALQKAFEVLKQKLGAEGLFAPEHKKPLPAFAQTIGVVTSPSGAAIQDILHVIERRYPAAHVVVYPTLVQGKEAAPNIVQAIELAQKHAQADVLIIARGGGSLEDLWPFNEEIVARAIYACTIPTISAVGHEVDFTIADFVADYRAPTPSAAAEITTPDGQALLATMLQLRNKAVRAMQHILYKHEQALKFLVKSLVHPGQQLHQYMQLCDELQLRLFRAMSHRLALKESRFASLVRALDALSPLAILQRGYSLTYDTNQVLLQSASQVKPGDEIVTQLSNGKVRSQVLGIE